MHVSCAWDMSLIIRYNTNTILLFLQLLTWPDMMTRPPKAVSSCRVQSEGVNCKKVVKRLEEPLFPAIAYTSTWSMSIKYGSAKFQPNQFSSQQMTTEHAESAAEGNKTKKSLQTHWIPSGRDGSSVGPVIIDARLSNTLLSSNHTSCGPYTAARTFVFPCSIYAEPSAWLNTPSLHWILRSSLGLRPSTRNPSSESKSIPAMICLAAEQHFGWRPPLFHRWPCPKKTKMGLRYTVTV